MKAFYIQQAEQISPIFGAASLQEAQEFSGCHPRYVIQTAEAVMMNPDTGSVGFESDWEEGVEALVPVRWCLDSEGWIEE